MTQEGSSMLMRSQTTVDSTLYSSSVMPTSSNQNMSNMDYSREMSNSDKTDSMVSPNMIKEDVSRDSQASINSGHEMY